MEKQEMYEFLKKLALDYYHGRKTKKETVDALQEELSPSDEIPPMTSEEEFIYNLYWDLFCLTSDPPRRTKDERIEYYIEVFNGKREYSVEDARTYMIERGIDKSGRKEKLANDIGEKIKALGLSDPTILAMGANLSYIYIYSEDYAQLISQFLEADIEDKEAIANILIEMRILVNHTKWHCNEAKKTLTGLIDYCRKES